MNNKNMNKEDLALLRSFKQAGKEIEKARAFEVQQIAYHLDHTCKNDKERLQFMIEIGKEYDIEEKDFKERFCTWYDYF